MAQGSDPVFHVLHAIRVKGFASADGIREVTGLGVAEVDDVLEQLQVKGAIAYRSGRIEGWRLTAEGRTLHAELLAADATPAIRARLIDIYGDFGPINSHFKEVCTAWQLRDGVTVNDHTDNAYDQGIIKRLGQVHVDTEPLCARLAEELDRFRPYRGRLQGALDRVREGQVAAFAQPLASSYHDVWMELHQDLLITLNLERTAADA